MLRYTSGFYINRFRCFLVSGGLTLSYTNLGSYGLGSASCAQLFHECPDQRFKLEPSSMGWASHRGVKIKYFCRIKRNPARITHLSPSEPPAVPRDESPSPNVTAIQPILESRSRSTPSKALIGYLETRDPGGCGRTFATFYGHLPARELPPHPYYDDEEKRALHR